MEDTATLVLDRTDIAIDDWSMVVVYDRQTGRIVHRHQTVTFQGARLPDRETLERSALELAAPQGTPAARRWAALHVDPRSLNAEAAYKVDPRKKALVEVKPRGRARRRR